MRGLVNTWDARFITQLMIFSDISQTVVLIQIIVHLGKVL